jgi:adenine-specific DNA-methyltransferase
LSFRYIGSKARVVAQIAEHLDVPKGRVFVDVFCGTGAVAEIAAERGWKVRLNDHLSSATTMAEARLLTADETPFNDLGGYDAAIASLNKEVPIEGFIWSEYSPASLAKLGLERRYFSEKNAGRIDAVRARIECWHRSNAINAKEKTLLLADLLGAANRVANIAGTYGCFLAKWTPQSAGDLELRARARKKKQVAIETSNLNATQIKVNPADLVYLDPPYTKRQYASYYHILETITLGDTPVVEGVSGLRPWKDLASDYCYKVRALRALCGLIDRLTANHILLSYSNEGHVDLTDLMLNLDSIGKVQMHELAGVGRYRPNVQASANRASVNEYLIEIEKQPIMPAVQEERLVFA